MTTLNEIDRPVHLYFNRHLPEVYGSLEMLNHLNSLGVNIIYCANWSELSENMKLKPKTICFHVNELHYTSAVEIVNMVNTLSKLLEQESTITVTVGIDSDTEYRIVKDLQKSNIFGIVPSTVSFGPEESKRALQAQWNNIPYWPKHILEKLPGSKKPARKSVEGIHLTPRQLQVLSLIKERGASNKVIAKTLKISESTVKLHVTAVLKKFNVRNRTQLALFSK